MGEHLVCDTETDGLLDSLTKLHMVQVGTLHGDDVTIYADGLGADVIAKAREGVTLGDATLTLRCPIRPLKEGLERIRAADMTYWHNGIGYDLPVLERFAPGVLERGRMRDTLVMARLLTREFDHRLEAWGKRLGVHKGDFKGPWDTVTPEMLAYSEQDVPVGRALALHLQALLPGGEAALETEQAVAYWISRQERTGFHLNEPETVRLHVDLQASKRELEASLRRTFPARWVAVGQKVPQASNSRYGYTKGVPFTRIEWDEFSPSNRGMIVRRLQEKGWKPTEFGASGAPTMDEDILAGLAGRFPEAADLATYFDLSKQAEFVGSWLKAATGGKVHGRVNTLGAYTQRMSHQKPNMAQIPKGGPYRALWLPRPGWKLVGVDGAAIQARGLAHYLYHWDGGRYGDIIVNGRSEDETDIHSMNAKAIGSLNLFPEAMSKKHRRDTAKNLNYAIYFGAQDARLGQTLKDGIVGYAKLKAPRIPNRELGNAIRRAMEQNMKGLSECNALVEATFEKRKSLKGVDGRKLFPPSKRNALVTLIQSLEAIVMKTALVIFCDRYMPARGWAYDADWALAANVHDEVQIEARPEIADAVGEAMADAICVAARELGLKVPFAGEAKVGDNWHETH